MFGVRRPHVFALGGYAGGVEFAGGADGDEAQRVAVDRHREVVVEARGDRAEVRRRVEWDVKPVLRRLDGVDEVDAARPVREGARVRVGVGAAELLELRLELLGEGLVRADDALGLINAPSSGPVNDDMSSRRVGGAHVNAALHTLHVWWRGSSA